MHLYRMLSVCCVYFSYDYFVFFFFYVVVTVGCNCVRTCDGYLKHANHDILICTCLDVYFKLDVLRSLKEQKHEQCLNRMKKKKSNTTSRYNNNILKIKF